MKKYLAHVLLGLGTAVSAVTGWAGANPAIPFYGGLGSIVATPTFPIVGEPTQIEVRVANTGDQPATGVQVKVSINDWGVTFNGWQEVATVNLSDPIPPGGTVTATVEHVFESRAHTCVEAIVVGAGENTDPNDDRGQINLEVLGAGETFSYDVPVRNNGDEPLELVIRGRCQGKDPGNTAGVNHEACKEIEEKVVVGPGEEVLVPVVLRLAGLPVGEAIEYLVEAVDGQGNRNHVVLRVIRSSARQLKKEALEQVQAVRAETPNRSLRNRLETIARHIRESLDARSWVDDDHLNRAGGPRVFALEGAATHLLLGLLESGLPLDQKAELNAAVLKLVDADRILAQAVVSEATGPQAEQGQESLAEGDAARAAGDYPEAIGAYRKAWQRTARGR